jgi:hypothetical protein
MIAADADVPAIIGRVFKYLSLYKIEPVRSL